MFLFPGEISRAEILEIVGANLTEICTVASARRPNVYWLRKDSVVSYEQRLNERLRRRK